MVDKNNKASTFFLRVLPMIVNKSIDCITLGRIIKYDKKKHEASVQPLALTSDGGKRAPFNYVVVPASIYQLDTVMKKITNQRSYDVQGGTGGTVKMHDLPKWKPMKVGSLVVVGACDREIDNLNVKSKNNYKIGTKRMHSFNDAVILGVVTP